MSQFFNFETRMRISPIQSRTSRRDETFLTLNLGFETRSRKSLLQSRALRQDRNLLYSFSGFETRTRVILSDLTFRNENESSKLLTFPQVSDLNGHTSVHANPGRPTTTKCAYDLSRIVFSVAFLLLGLQYHYCPSRRKFIAS